MWLIINGFNLIEDAEEEWRVVRNGLGRLFRMQLVGEVGNGPLPHGLLFFFTRFSSFLLPNERGSYEANHSSLTLT